MDAMNTWKGFPPGARPVLAICTRDHPRKLVGRGALYRFGDGWLGVIFDPAEKNVETTGIAHADGGKTFRFICPRRGCGHEPEAREEKRAELLEGLADLGRLDTLGRTILDVGMLP